VTRYLFVASLLAAATTTSQAHGGEPAVTEAKATDLPAKLVPRGHTVARVVKFTDRNGANYVVFSSTSSEKRMPDDDLPVRTVWLYVDHWAIATGKAPRALLPARDVVECYMGASLAKFVDKAFTVTDLDGDGLAEITYGYQLACRSDVSTATYKLLLVENGKKLILRGNTRLAHDNLPESGTFKPEPDAKKWPAGFFAHAVEVWEATAADLDDPTNG
jgi:hypothetical protein